MRLIDSLKSWMNRITAPAPAPVPVPELAPATTAVTGTPDIQDPLPESKWFWRRVFIYLTMGSMLWLLWIAIDIMGKAAILEPGEGIQGLVTSIKWMIGFNALVVTYYLLAPSGEQLTRMIQMGSMFRFGVQQAQRTIVRPDGSSESAGTLGKPPAPPVPPATGDGAAPAPEVTSEPKKKETEILE